MSKEVPTSNLSPTVLSEMIAAGADALLDRAGPNLWDHPLLARDLAEAVVLAALSRASAIQEKDAIQNTPA